MKQFEDVDCHYGAPMGRPEYLNNTDAKARCFKVKLQDGCYDDGGAYWGGPSNIYCATNGDGFRWFTRAKDRKEALQHFNLKAETLRKYVRWIKPHKEPKMATPQERLEYLRGEIEAERISYEEIFELQTLIPYIEPGDVLLLEWAGVPEFP